MTEFTKHTADSTQEEAQPVLEGVQKGLGFVPNLIAYMQTHQRSHKGIRH